MVKFVAILLLFLAGCFNGSGKLCCNEEDRDDTRDYCQPEFTRQSYPQGSLKCCQQRKVNRGEGVNFNCVGSPAFKKNSIILMKIYGNGGLETKNVSASYTNLTAGTLNCTFSISGPDLINITRLDFIWPNQSCTRQLMVEFFNVRPVTSEAPSVTVGSTTMGLATMGPATMGPATMGPATMGPATMGPATMASTTMSPATMGPATMGPATMGPATMGPATMGPATMGPATMGPATMGPATMGPATMGPAESTMDTTPPITQLPTNTKDPNPLLAITLPIAAMIVVVVAVGLSLCIMRCLHRSREQVIISKNETCEIELHEGEGASHRNEEASDLSLPQQWSIPWVNMTIGWVFDNGFFGALHEGEVTIEGERSKAKIYKMNTKASANDRREFMKKFQTLTTVGRHPNVVGILGACKHEDILYVALDFPPNGDLWTYLRNARTLGDDEQSTLSSENLIQFASDVANGMQHLTALGIIHRDLAAKNILLDSQMVAKVSNFGLSQERDFNAELYQNLVPVWWPSPESLANNTYTSKSDVWSFGMVMWEIATLGSTPYERNVMRDLSSKLQNEHRLPKPDNCDDEMYSLMLMCWRYDPANRPNFNKLVTLLTNVAGNLNEQLPIPHRQPPSPPEVHPHRNEVGHNEYAQPYSQPEIRPRVEVAHSYFS